MSYTKNQLANITNTNLIASSAKQWRRPDGLQARSAARELELQQKLKLQAGLKDQENNNEHSTKFTSTVNLSDSELSAKKKEFTRCVFYLDNLEASAKASLERAIVLLGAVSSFLYTMCTFFFFYFAQKLINHIFSLKKSFFQENALISLQPKIFLFKKICCNHFVIQSKHSPIYYK